MLKRAALSVLAIGVLLQAAGARFSADQYLAHIKYLASDELKGRGNNEPELEKAAGYIEREFQRSGLKAFRSLKGYKQFFEITAESWVAPSSYLQIGARIFQLDKDFSLLSFSDQLSGHSEAIFCGYGINSADAGYNDYAGRDVHGKVVVILDGYPRLPEKQEHVALLADMQSKIVLAKNQGATALALIGNPLNSPSRAAERMGIIAFTVTQEVASALLGAGPDRWNDPHASLAPTRLNWNLQVKEKQKRVANVVGYLSGSGVPQEWVLVGAHYDHLGLGEKFALDPQSVGQPHNGADDNASGTAAVLCLAQALASSPSPLRRGTIFVTFAGEELGLLGSAHFVKNLPSEAQHLVAMVNMDMIGRAQGKIFLGGVGTAQEFGELVKGLISPLKIEISQSGLGGSDHMSFTLKGIPALFFFSGLHSDYHKATDNWQKINLDTSMQVLDLVNQVITNLASSSTPLHFLSVAESRPAAGGSGYGAYFGSIPDFAQDVKGVRFADVRAGSPAQKAGLKAGDVLVKFHGKTIENLHDFTFALRTHAPGQVVEVEYLRGGQLSKTRVTLEKRQ